MEDEWMERVEGRWREGKGGEKGEKIVVSIQNKEKRRNKKIYIDFGINYPANT